MKPCSVDPGADGDVDIEVSPDADVTVDVDCEEVKPFAGRGARRILRGCSFKERRQ